MNRFDKKPIAIYCVGSYKKGGQDVGRTSWSDDDYLELIRGTGNRDVVFLRPDDRTDDAHNPVTVFGRDLYHIQMSDFLVVDAREKRGIGAGIEMFAAKYYGKAVVTVAPPNTHYRSADWSPTSRAGYIHTHLLGASDEIVDGFHEAGRWIASFLESGRTPRSISEIEVSVREYLDTQLEKDHPMQTTIEKLRGGPRSR